MNQGDYQPLQKFFQDTHPALYEKFCGKIYVIISGRSASRQEAREEPDKGIGIRVVSTAR